MVLPGLAPGNRFKFERPTKHFLVSNLNLLVSLSKTSDHWLVVHEVQTTRRRFSENSFCVYIFLRKQGMPPGHTQFASLAETLRASLCLYQLPCEQTDGYSKPEVEFGDSQHLILPPQHLLGSKQDKILVEAAINSVRISLKLHPVEPLDEWLRSKRIQLIQHHADDFRIVRRVPVPGHCLSFLVTVEHLQLFDKAQLIGWICECISQLSSAHDIKRLAVSRGRAAGCSLWQCLPN